MPVYPRAARKTLRADPAIVPHKRGTRLEKTSSNPAGMSAHSREPLVAVISLASQRISVYDGSGMIAQSRVSTGMAGHQTPAGVYSILQRNRYHESNIYSGAPMPFMQRLTWSGIALHAGVVPGYPASHGCIRLPAEFATKMWGLARIGTRVVIAHGDLVPTEIAHAKLPEPRMTPIPVSVAAPLVQTAAVSGSKSDVEQNLLDPLRLAQARRAQTLAAQAAAEKAVRPAFDTAREKSADAARASEALRAAQRTAAAAQERVSALQNNRGQNPASTPEAEATARQSLTEAQADLDTAQKALSAQRVMEFAASDAAFAAAHQAREAEAEASRLAEEVKLIPSTLEPISVFVSKKEGRILFRQGFVPVFEEALQLKEPDRPLGTHVFTAITSSTDGAKLKWLVTTFPPAQHHADKPQTKRGRYEAPAAPVARLPASSASDALDRISFSEEARSFIAERLWPGASLIISDDGTSLETGKGTDFVIQPR